MDFFSSFYTRKTKTKKKSLLFFFNLPFFLFCFLLICLLGNVVCFLLVCAFFLSLLNTDSLNNRNEFGKTKTRSEKRFRRKFHGTHLLPSKSSFLSFLVLSLFFVECSGVKYFLETSKKRKEKKKNKNQNIVW